MNTIHRRSAWGIAFAGFIMTATAACGSETAVAPANISDPIEQERTVSSTQDADACLGQRLMSADQWERAARACTSQPASADERREAQSRMDAYGRVPQP